MCTHDPAGVDRILGEVEDSSLAGHPEEDRHIVGHLGMSLVAV